MKTLNLTSSRFFGGPERQMLGLAQAGRDLFATSFASFSEQGLCRDFLGRVAQAGFPSHELQADTPHLLRAVKEVQALLKSQKIDVLLVHGYKAGLVGWRAARRAGIPVIAVSRGWTWENWKMKLYERLDKFVLRWVDAVVSVSQAQADKVRSCGVPDRKIVVIPNAIDISRFDDPDHAGRIRLEKNFPKPPQQIIGAAGRLSPEKGFNLLIEAAQTVVAQNSNVGFVLFGEGPLRDSLAEQITRRGLQDHFVLSGFCSDLDVLLPHLDLFVQSSHTEGMPNVILEALAAGVPVVATNVGGTREIIQDGCTGRLVDRNSANQLAESINEFLDAQSLSNLFSTNGKLHIESKFGFANQAESYGLLFAQLVPPPKTQKGGIMHLTDTARPNSLGTATVKAEFQQTKQ